MTAPARSVPNEPYPPQDPTDVNAMRDYAYRMEVHRVHLMNDALEDAGMRSRYEYPSPPLRYSLDEVEFLGADRMGE